MYDNSFEKAPGSIETKAERIIPASQDFAKSMAEGVPEFAGNQFGIAKEENKYYGETVDESNDSELSDYNEGLSDAASLVNYGLDAVAREKGVETVVQGIKNFDATGSENPLRDLYIHLGIDTTKELDDTSDESLATKTAREHFRNEYNMPRSQRKSREGVVKAIQDMKELISEVEGADPRYEELRSAARAYGKGYFEYAVKDFGLRGLTDLFGTLAKQHEEKQQPEEDSNLPEQRAQVVERPEKQNTEQPDGQIPTESLNEHTP